MLGLLGRPPRQRGSQTASVQVTGEGRTLCGGSPLSTGGPTLPGRRAGGVQPPSRGATQTAGVASGHPAPKQYERRAGKASGKFQEAAEGSLQRAQH